MITFFVELQLFLSFMVIVCTVQMSILVIFQVIFFF